MIKQFFVIGIITLLSVTIQAQYISEVLEYKPAPGQFINEVPWGTPVSANSIIGTVSGNLCLGGFGGYVVFKFEQSVENHPDNPYGIDFTIFGNANSSSSEPGVVFVMKDENSNNLPDDTWYELAGSDHFFTSTKNNYEITYTNPNAHADVPWTDNLGNSGIVKANSFHTHNYYPFADSFPNIAPDEYALSGTWLNHIVDSSNTALVTTYKKAFGYADNLSRGSAPYTLPDNPYTPEKENSGGDGFDIDWAIDSDGNYVTLDAIDFIRVQNGVNGDVGWLGELSTEITGAADVAPDVSFTGENRLLVLKDFPPVVYQSQLQLESKYFVNGRNQQNTSVVFEVTTGNATIDENDLLNISASGEIKIDAWLADQPEIKASIITFADLTTNVTENLVQSKLQVWPNPAKDFIEVGTDKETLLEIITITGETILKKRGNIINIQHLNPGVYFIRTEAQISKFIKE